MPGFDINAFKENPSVEILRGIQKIDWLILANKYNICVNPISPLRQVIKTVVYVLVKRKVITKDALDLIPPEPVVDRKLEVRLRLAQLRIRELELKKKSVASSHKGSSNSHTNKNHECSHEGNYGSIADSPQKVTRSFNRKKLRCPEISSAREKGFTRNKNGEEMAPTIKINTFAPNIKKEESFDFKKVNELRNVKNKKGKGKIAFKQDDNAPPRLTIFPKNNKNYSKQVGICVEQRKTKTNTFKSFLPNGGEKRESEKGKRIIKKENRDNKKFPINLHGGRLPANEMEEVGLHKVNSSKSEIKEETQETTINTLVSLVSNEEETGEKAKNRRLNLSKLAYPPVGEGSRDYGGITRGDVPQFLPRSGFLSPTMEGKSDSGGKANSQSVAMKILKPDLESGTDQLVMLPKAVTSGLSRFEKCPVFSRTENKFRGRSLSLPKRKSEAFPWKTFYKNNESLRGETKGSKFLSPPEEGKGKGQQTSRSTAWVRPKKTEANNGFPPRLTLEEVNLPTLDVEVRLPSKLVLKKMRRLYSPVKSVKISRPDEEIEEAPQWKLLLYEKGNRSPPFPKKKLKLFKLL